MWCTDCQQDVPAVARSAQEALQCPRCQHELAASTTSVSGEMGIPLESFDQAAEVDAATADGFVGTLRDWFDDEPACQRQREINRILHAPYHQASAGPVAPALDRRWPELPSMPGTSLAASAPGETAALLSAATPSPSTTSRVPASSANRRKRTPTSWLLSAMLSVGSLCFCTGVALLAWSAAFQLQPLWQQSMTLTIGAEGLLILSLTWMAVRLWRNSRQLNRQLHGVDRQLVEMEQRTSALVGGQTASSQHFYHHFSQVANPHLLMANLQGQVDQMAARVAVE